MVLGMPNTTDRSSPALDRPTARRLRTTAAVALAATALLAVGTGCSNSTAAGSSGATSTTAAEDHIASDAEVATGLMAIQTLNASAVQQLTTDQASAQA